MRMRRDLPCVITESSWWKLDPELFSRNVRHFWRPKDPTLSKSPANIAEILRLTRETVDRLVYLIRFYNI
jgi:hypothetical protein